MELHINHPENEILYFGDLDYEGIGIYERLASLFSRGGEKEGECINENKDAAGAATDAMDGHAQNKTAGSTGAGDLCEIKPFIRAYEKMIEKARECGNDFLPHMSGNQNQNLSGLFFRYFSHETKEAMMRLLEAGKYIPQEIVAITDF